MSFRVSKCLAFFITLDHRFPTHGSRNFVRVGWCAYLWKTWMLILYGNVCAFPFYESALRIVQRKTFISSRKISTEPQRGEKNSSLVSNWINSTVYEWIMDGQQIKEKWCVSCDVLVFKKNGCYRKKAQCFLSVI